MILIFISKFKLQLCLFSVLVHVWIKVRAGRLVAVVHHFSQFDVSVDFDLAVFHGHTWAHSRLLPNLSISFRIRSILNCLNFSAAILDQAAQYFVFGQAESKYRDHYWCEHQGPSEDQGPSRQLKWIRELIYCTDKE